MNIAIFYDTETTGLPLFDQPSDDPRQPHLVQLAAALVDLDTRETLSSLDVIIRPDGWTIPEEVSAIHGITTEKAMDLGVSEGNAVDMFLPMWNQRLRIAHNEQFDARILRIAIQRFIDPGHPDLVEPPSDMWKASSADCTAKRATPIVKCPPTARMVAAGRNHYKTPNLGEAYQFFTGQPLEGAHNAMVDVKACVAVHFGIQDYQAQ